MTARLKRNAHPHLPPLRTPPAENHPRGNASVGRSWSPDLLLRLQVQPFDDNQRGQMARSRQAVRPMLVTKIIELNDKRCGVRFGAGSVSIPLPIALVARTSKKHRFVGEACLSQTLPLLLDLCSSILLGRPSLKLL
jgi:hypothetical protein